MIPMYVSSDYQRWIDVAEGEWYKDSDLLMNQ